MREDIASFLAGRDVEGAEVANRGADIGIADVAIDDVGNDIIGMELNTAAVGEGRRRAAAVGAWEQWDGRHGPGPLNALHMTERAMELYKAAGEAVGARLEALGLPALPHPQTTTRRRPAAVRARRGSRVS